MNLYQTLLDNKVILKQKCILKSGIESDFYVDIKRTISMPKVFNEIVDLLYKNLKRIENISSYSILGVPYSGIPFASVLANKLGIPLLLMRNETKKYGTKKRIEGCEGVSKNLILIEDVMTTGQSILETVKELFSEGFSVNYVYTIFQRGDLDYKIFQQLGIKYDYLTKFYDLEDDYSNTISKLRELEPTNKTFKLIGYLMDLKKSNIILSMDNPDVEEFKRVVLDCADNILGVKVHIDIFEEEDREVVREFLIEEKIKSHLLIIEDRKFADICSTNLKQLKASKVSEYADIIICHGIAGFEFLKHCGLPVILVAELSNRGNLIDHNYTESCIEAASRRSNVIGFVSQKNLGYNKVLYFKPGVKIPNENCSNQDSSKISDECTKILMRDKYDQSYTSKTQGIDFYIVGRGITESENPKEESLKYKNWF